MGKRLQPDDIHQQRRRAEGSEVGFINLVFDVPHPSLSRLRGREQLNFVANQVGFLRIYQMQHQLRFACLGLCALFMACCATLAAAAPVQPVVPAASSFADNPIVYFVVTDRFLNGNPANDHSYGRINDGKQEIGTFHGGDLAGLTAKLKAGYFTQLGVNAIWITAPYEQIHGWVQGGNAEFKHYAYHGYYALDYTRLDQNMGTPGELKEMVDTAHAKGIRVLFDIVMNHPGYADIKTLSEYLPELLWPNWENYTLKNYHRQIDYNNFEFTKWWGGDWVRSGLPGYPEGGTDDLTKQLAYLPDFRTESKAPVKLPYFLKERKKDTAAVDLPNTPVRGYLVKWLSDWVREYGIDGFRCDTAKHVELPAWLELKQAGNAALADWKSKNPGNKIDNAPFWMVGEVFPHGVDRDAYFDNGFDSLINFDFQDQKLDNPAALDRLYANFAEHLAHGRSNGKVFDVLSYISSHDTKLFPRDQLIDAGSALLLAPGGVQIFYGDESGRLPGPSTSGDPQQATRSDMNWNSPDVAVLAHWQKLGQFRLHHVALARGEHHKLAETPYVFSRFYSNDKVVVSPKVTGTVTIPVASVFSDGEIVRDAYSGTSVKVVGGKVSLDAKGAVLLENIN
jgi:alpha-amylase